MPIVYLTRRERFSSAHRIYNPEWTDEKNYEVYGKCSNPKWHGHNYDLFVTVKGNMNQENGYLVDISLLSKIIRETVIDKLDHKNINLETDFMVDKIVSTENLAVEIWKLLTPYVEKLNIKLHCIRIEETENNIIEYYGE